MTEKKEERKEEKKVNLELELDVPADVEDEFKKVIKLDGWTFGKAKPGQYDATVGFTAWVSDTPSRIIERLSALDVKYGIIISEFKKAGK